MTSTALASRPPRAQVSAKTWKALDTLRLRRWQSLVEQGEDEEAAWLVVVTDPALGYRSSRGKTGIKREKLLHTLGLFLKRAAPHLLEQAQSRAMIRLSTMLDGALDAVDEAQRGELTGEVDDTKATAWAAVANARTRAATVTLRATGIINTGTTTNVDARTAVQVNHVEVSRDHVQRILADGTARERALDLAAALEAAPGEPA